MAINYELINKGGISLGTNFELLSEKPLDSRLVVPSLDGLQNYIDSAAAYEGMIAYVSSEKKHYEVKVIDGVLSYRPFGLTDSELNEIITNATTAAMEFKGATATLPENPAKGDMYKVAGENIDITIDGVDAQVGDAIVFNGEQWFLIPSGDDIEDTWRPVTDVANDATLTFVAGDKLDVAVASTGEITYKHEAIAAPEDVTAEGDEKTRTYITAVETDGYGHITGYKTATENVEDTNTEYTFESQVESSNVYFNVTADTEGATEQTIYVDAYSKNEVDTKLEGKVDTETYTEMVNSFDSVHTGLGDAIMALDERVTPLESAVNSNGQAIENLQGQFTGLESQMGSKLDAGTYEGEKASFATKTEVQAVDNKLVNYVTTASYAEDKTANANAHTSLEGEIAKKVDAIDGYSLVADTEIARLADVDNYNDEEVRGLIGDNAQDIEDLGKYVGTIPTTYTETNVIDYINKKAQETLAAASGNSTETAASVKQQLDDYVGANNTRVEAIESRMGTAEGKIAALETESAKHALKTEVEAVDAKFADYNTTVAQKAIDDAQDARIKAIEDAYLVEADIANFETKENVKKVADDLAAYVESNDEALASVKATAEAATTVSEVDAQIDAKITALNLGTTYEPIGAEDRAKAYVDGKFTDANLAQYTTEQEVKDIVDGVIAGAADKDTYNSLTKLVDYIDAHGGEATEMASAIETLEGDVKGLKEAPSAGIKATDITAWNGEIGAKALAESKTTTVEVKDQIEAYGYATTGYADGKANDAKDAAIADAATKYETIGTAQGIVDALKLGETYEPIGAESRAIAAAKTETENQVKALAGEGNTSTVKKNADDIASLFEQLQWGEF